MINQWEIERGITINITKEEEKTAEISSGGGGREPAEKVRLELKKRETGILRILEIM